MPRTTNGFLHLQLDGHEQVALAFRLMPDVLKGKAIRPALRAGARIVVRRAKALAPRLTGRLARGRWTLRAASGRRNLVGVRVAVPYRDELGIRPAARGFYPFSQEFGWRVGREIHGPLDVGGRVYKLDSIGRLRRANERTLREARALLNSVRRKVPGRRFMRDALFGQQSEVVAAVAETMRARIETLSPDSLTLAGQWLEPFEDRESET